MIVAIRHTLITKLQCAWRLKTLPLLIYDYCVMIYIFCEIKSLIDSKQSDMTNISLYGSQTSGEALKTRTFKITRQL